MPTSRDNCFRIALLAACWLAACAPPPQLDDDDPAPEERDLAYFLRRLHRLEHLPELEQAHTAMESTWDRTGGNDDGYDYKQVEGDRNVLLDADGPGCVHRLYTGLLGEAVEGTRIQIFLDHASTPLFDQPVSEFFSQDGPWPYPLVAARTLPGSHFPIPFAQHIRIQLVSSAASPSWGVVWQVTYTQYPDGTPVRSLSWPLSEREKAELAQVLGSWLVAPAMPPEPPASWSVARTLALPAGASEGVALPGSGVIRELRARVSPGASETLKGIRLKMFWDGSAEPSVDVPLGYLLGHGDHPDARFSSLLLGVADGEAYCRLPMPFADGARLRLENRSAAAAQIELALDVEPLPRLPATWGRFHATWHRRRALLPDAPRVGPQQIPAHTVLERDGPGKYVGTLLQVDWPFWPAYWGEGDWLIWTDEDAWPPSYHGTGTEEYFNSGWTMFERRAVSGWISVRPGLVGVYSFHLNDAFPFQRNIRVLLETVGSGGGEWLLPLLRPPWGTTALWYALPAQPAGSTP